MQNIEQELNDLNLLNTIQNLSEIIQQYDTTDAQSELALFSKEDPLKNIKQGLADKLSLESGKDISETLKESEKIVEQVKLELQQSNVKSKICAARTESTHK